MRPLLHSMSLKLHVSSDYFNVQPLEFSFLQQRNMCNPPHTLVLDNCKDLILTTPAQYTDFAREFLCCPAYVVSLRYIDPSLQRS
jgi:hypothetical protein